MNVIVKTARNIRFNWGESARVARNRRRELAPLMKEVGPYIKIKELQKDLDEQKGDCKGISITTSLGAQAQKILEAEKKLSPGALQIEVGRQEAKEIRWMLVGGAIMAIDAVAAMVAFSTNPQLPSWLHAVFGPWANAITLGAAFVVGMACALKGAVAAGKATKYKAALDAVGELKEGAKQPVESSE
ncbi:MAG: hypothetical protein WC717_05430 [Candidatus Micrarchaeia archaeon]